MCRRGCVYPSATSTDACHARRPSRIEVWRANAAGAIGGEDGDDFTEEVEVQLTDLKLVLFDEGGNEIELPVHCTYILRLSSCALQSS